MNPLLVRVHRWTAALFALPLLVVVATGLILSFEPIAYDRHLTDATVSTQAVLDALAKHDPDGKARSLAVRAYEGTMTLSTGGGAEPRRIDLHTGEVIDPSRTLWSDVLIKSRRLHEKLLLDLSWLVIGSTIALLAMMILGYLMGWMRPRNTARGWHRATGWFLAPLLVLSPLTGLAIAFGVSFGATLQPASPGSRVALAEAVKVVAAERSLADVVWVRPLGGALRARIYDGREANIYLVGKEGLVRGAANWPRALHEGTWAGAYSGGINVLISVALLGLMGTGFFMWVQRTRRRGSRRANRTIEKSAQRPLAANRRRSA